MKSEASEPTPQESPLLFGDDLSSSRVRLLIILIMMQESINSPLQAFLRLLPSQRCDIKEMISRQKDVSTPPICTISVENLSLLFVEDTVSRLLSIQPVHDAVLQHSFFIVVIVLCRLNGLVHGDVKIVVEVLAERGIPWDVVPAHALLVCRDLANRGAGD